MPEFIRRKALELKPLSCHQQKLRRVNNYLVHDPEQRMQSYRSSTHVTPTYNSDHTS